MKIHLLQRSPHNTIIIVLCFFLSLYSYAGNLKVTGYFPSYRATTNVAAQCAYLTDIIYSFINPSTTGSLIKTSSGDANFDFDASKFTVVKDAAAAKGTNLWLALGGADASGLRSARLSSVCSNSTYRTTLATELVAYANSFGCYGISIDWEFPTSSADKSNHLALLQAIHTAILASSNVNLKVALAVGGEYAGTTNHLGYADASLFSTNASLVDEWHVMAYDMPAPNGTPYDANNHSSLADAQGSMEGWNGKGVPYSKMLLGLPFYARSSTSRSTTLEYNNLGGTASTNYSQDNYGTYYYNGCPTLQSKIDLAYTTKQAMGVMIWDLGQDFAPSNQYSLLSCINTKKTSLCPVPKPNLGADRGFCSPNTVTLDPGVPSSTGRTFSWYKDNVLLGSETGITLVVSAAGTYKVHIAEGTCYAEDEVIIVAGSPFTTTGASGCSGDNLTLTVNNPTNGKTYDWYDASVSGTKVATGTSVSQIFNSTTTWYVEEKASGVNTYTSSAQTYSDIVTLGGVFWAQGTDSYRGQRITVSADLTVKSVRVYVSQASGATFKIRVLKSVDNSLVAETSTFTYATATVSGDGYTIEDINVGLALTPGDYFIYPELSSGVIGFGANKGLAFTQSGVFDVEANSYVDWSGGGTATFLTSEKTDASHIHYGCLFKIVIETGANASCGRTAATATVVTCGPPSITIVKPTSNQDFPFDGNAIALEATITDEGSVASRTFEIYDGNTLLSTITTSANGSTFTGSWTATTWYSSHTYTLKVSATDNSNNTSTASVDFTVTSGLGVNEISVVNAVNLYPNPSSENVNVTVSATKVGMATITVYDLTGRVVYSASQNLSAGNNLSSINVANFNAGAYLLNISANGETMNKTFTVVK